jgi:tight adherence protein C
LIAAGFTGAAAPRLYVLIRLVLVLILPTVTFLLLGVTNSRGILTLYLACSSAGLAGLYLPALFIRARADRRREKMVNGFPDALDLLLICVESGLSVDASFDRVGREMAVSHPLLANSFANVVLELRAGRSREEALKQMATRSGIEEIRSFTTLLIQSSQLGTSVAQALRIYSSEMREKRRMRAEEKAHKIPVLISIPLVGCMLPVMIGVLMLPAAIRVIRTLLPAMSGQ